MMMSQDRAVFLGHATNLIEVGGTRLLTDPVLRDHLLHLRRHGTLAWRPEDERLDAVLLSHLHHDHLDAPSMRRLDPSIPVLAPRGSARTLRGLGRADVRELEVGEAVRIGNVTVTATQAVHAGGRAFGDQAEAIGFTIDGPGAEADGE